MTFSISRSTGPIGPMSAALESPKLPESSAPGNDAVESTPGGAPLSNEEKLDLVFKGCSQERRDAILAVHGIKPGDEITPEMEKKLALSIHEGDLVDEAARCLADILGLGSS